MQILLPGMEVIDISLLAAKFAQQQELGRNANSPGVLPGLLLFQG
jgi:hypothetical protein